MPATLYLKPKTKKKKTKKRKPWLFHQAQTNVAVPASLHTPVDLGTWPSGAGNASELLVTFALPDHAATFGVVVMAEGVRHIASASIITSLQRVHGGYQ